MAQKRDWNAVRRKRDLVIRFRASAKEQQQITEDAERVGISVGAYIRQVLLDAPIPRQSRRPVAHAEQLAAMLGHIGKVGSNLNQIARHLNTGLPTDNAFLRESVAALVDMKADLKQALGRRT